MDRSPGELVWVTSDRWGPLQGSLLNLSYGTGRIFVVPHEKMGGQLQGGVVALPLPDFPTGTMRGRFHPGANGNFRWRQCSVESRRRCFDIGRPYQLRRRHRPVDRGGAASEERDVDHAWDRA